MNITKDVIIDLLPLYLAKEASDDTRQLVESYLAEHPDLDRIAREDAMQDPPRISAEVSPDLELRTLTETRRRLRLRSWVIGLAIFFSLFTVSFSADDRGRVRWAWSGAPAVAVVLGALALGCWITYFWLRRRSNVIGT